MKINKSLLIVFTIISVFTISSCKKDKNEEAAEAKLAATTPTIVTTNDIIAKLTNDSSKTWSRTIVGAVGTGLETWLFNKNGSLTFSITSTNGGPTASPSVSPWSLYGTTDKLTTNMGNPNVYTINSISATELKMTGESAEIVILTAL